MKTSILILLLISSSYTAFSQKNIDDYKIIGDSTNIYKSIDDILTMDEFNGKVVYVDVWGTRCPPCLNEFAYIADLKEKFKNSPIEYLYLCSPYSMTWDDSNAELWKELIVKHNLEGINIFMSPECYMDGFFEKYKEKYPPERLWGIPTYLLVNKQGNIVDFDAPRPSTKDKLYNKIQILLDN